MNIFLKELTNRLISYLIRVSQGENQEEKLTHLLKKTLLFTLMAFILTLTMTFKYFLAGWYVNDLEKAVSKIDVFMGEQQSNMTQLFNINKDQYAELQRLSAENKELRGDLRTVLLANDNLSKVNADLETKHRSKNK